jgi:chitin synthase
MSHPSQPPPPKGGYYPGQEQQQYYPTTSESQPFISGGGSGSVSFAVGTEYPQQKHFGQAPARQPRRYKTTKRVALFNGNLVLDCPVPTKLLSTVPRQDDREFTHMRYTACTCNPDDFKKDNYTLRQDIYDPRRSTELFIVLTMYNVSIYEKCRHVYNS